MLPIHQSVQVTYHYSVHFTNRLFALENPLLRDVVNIGDAKSPKKILCIIDSWVCQYHPDLLDAIHAYCQYHESHLHLVRPPLIIEGGESAKNDPLNVTT